MMLEILKGCLTPQHQAAGLQVIELDDRILKLVDSLGNTVANYSAIGVQPWSIRKDADKWIEDHNN